MLSSPAEASHFPSGLIAKAIIGPVCPVNRRTEFPVWMSHMRMVLSVDPVKTYAELG